MLIPGQARPRRGNCKPKIRLRDAEVLIERWVGWNVALTGLGDAPRRYVRLHIQKRRV
jgi:hypothetical protein